MSDDKTRVVVTGLGVISGCGIGHQAFFDSCVNGRSSLDTVKRFDASNYPCTIASEVPDEMFNPADFFTNPKNVKSNDRYTHFAIAAARQALKDAGLGDTPDFGRSREKQPHVVVWFFQEKEPEPVSRFDSGCARGALRPTRCDHMES